MKKILNIGLDVGSTTVKIVVIDQKKNIVYKNYKRHLSNTKKTIIDLLNDFLKKQGNAIYTLSLTGSGALSLAKYLKLDFIQEVIACKNAITEYAPNTSVAIELGGEDAKIIYFDRYHSIFFLLNKCYSNSTWLDWDNHFCTHYLNVLYL